MRRFAGLAIAVIVIAFGSHVHAGLLTSAYESQLEAWLGEGDLDFTNIFTKTQGSSSADFHAAVDGKGRTFTLIQLLFAPGPTDEVVGGYNPQSWNSSSSYNLTLTDAERTGFIYNLTTGVIQRQNLSTDSPFIAPDSADWQTYNANDYGPTFGGGHDLVTDSTLTAGGAYNYSYGGTSYSYSASSVNIFGKDFSTPSSYGELEVYTFTRAAAVPEPGSMTLLGLGTAGLAGYVRRRRKTA